MKIWLLFVLVLTALPQAYGKPPPGKTDTVRFTGNGITFLYSKSLQVDSGPELGSMVSVSGTNGFGLIVMVYAAGFQTVSRMENIAISAYEKAAKGSGCSVRFQKMPTRRMILGAERKGTRLLDYWNGKPRVTDIFIVEKNDRIVQIYLMLPPSNHPQRRMIMRVLQSLALTESRKEDANTK